MNDFEAWLNENYDDSLSASAAWASQQQKINKQAAEIERLNTIIRIAAGYISTTDGWSDKHPEECLAWLLKQTGEVES